MVNSDAHRLDVVSTAVGWALSGEIDASTSPSIVEAFASLPDTAASTGRIVVEAAEVTFIDSSGLRVLIDLAERATIAGAIVVIGSPSRPVARLIELTGLGEMFTIEPA